MLKLMISWIWQLPQNLLGFILSRGYKLKSVKCVDIEHSKWVNVYFKHFFGSAISLGDYIILDYLKYCGKDASRMVASHEYGHSRQSLILGWLYLPLVGLPSIIINIWDRLFHRNWLKEQRTRWYYSRYPENWADRLGGVVRS